jgi:hypothetical protein
VLVAHGTPSSVMPWRSCVTSTARRPATRTAAMCSEDAV